MSAYKGMRPRASWLRRILPGGGPVVADQACIAFLKWCLPEFGLRWPDYRKVRRLVGKRLTRRLAELGLADLDAYRALLLREPDEWARLDVSTAFRSRGSIATATSVTSS